MGGSGGVEKSQTYQEQATGTGVNCSSSLLSFALPSLLTHSSGYTPGGDSYHFPINFLFPLVSPPPPPSPPHPTHTLSFSQHSPSQLHNWVFCAIFEEIQSCNNPHRPSEVLKSAVKRFFLPSFLLLSSSSSSFSPPRVAVLRNLTSVFISPSSAGT